MIASSTFVAADGEGYELNMGRWSRRLVGPFLDFVGMDRAERVLDVGCGTGHLARAASELDDTVEVHGVDLSEAYIKHAAAHSANPKLAYRVGDARAGVSGRGI